MTASESLVNMFLRERFDLSSEDHSGFWKTREVRAMPYDDGQVYVHLTGVVDSNLLALDMQSGLRKLVQQTRQRHFTEVIERMTRQRWIGPYRWRK